jgi:hypothetical protein
MCSGIFSLHTAALLPLFNKSVALNTQFHAVQHYLYVVAVQHLLTQLLTSAGCYMQKAITTQSCYLLGFKRAQVLAVQRTTNSATNLITNIKATLSNFLKNILKGSK